MREAFDRTEWLNSLMAFKLSQEDAPSIIEDIQALIAHQRGETLEECAKLAVARMVYWTEGDGKQSQDFRDGVEQACGDISRALRALLSPAPSTDGTGETKCQHVGAPFRGECPKCDRELP